MNFLARWLARLPLAREAPVPRGDPTRVAEVEAVLAELAALFRADGGDVWLVSIEEGVVIVRLVGACASCAASAETLSGALEPRLRARLAWFRELRHEP